jgi:hypothetical protein
MKMWLLLVGTLASAVGCHRPATTVTAPSPPAAAALLDSMDTRVPVPLLPMMANHQKQNMRDHLHAVQEIVGAVGAGDFDAIARAAGTIGYSEQMGQMCNHMGAGAPGFTDQAIRFHHTADKIAEAAREQDMPAVLTALNKTLATCTGCHATFKQRVVDETTWASLAGQPTPQHH